MTTFVYFCEDVTFFGIHPTRESVLEAITSRASIVSIEEIRKETDVYFDEPQTSQKLEEMREVYIKTLSSRIYRVPLIGEWDSTLYCLRIDGLPIVTSSREIFREYNDLVEKTPNTYDLIQVDTNNQTYAFMKGTDL